MESLLLTEPLSLPFCPGQSWINKENLNTVKNNKMPFWILRASRASSEENYPSCQHFQESQISPAMQLCRLSRKLFCTFGAKGQYNKWLQWTTLLLHQIASESTTSGFSGAGNLPFRISLSSCLFAYILLDTAIPVWVQGRLEAAGL